MKRLLVVLTLIMSVSACKLADWTGDAQKTLDTVEVANTVAQINPMFDYTTAVISDNWDKFSVQEQNDLVSVYNRLDSVRLQVKNMVENQDVTTLLITLADIRGLHSQVKGAYVQGADVVWGKLHTFSRQEQMDLVLLDSRMRKLDAALVKLESSTDSDATRFIDQILLTLGSAAQLYGNIRLMNQIGG